VRRLDVLQSYPSISKLALAACCVAPWTQGYERRDSAGDEAAFGNKLHGHFAALALGGSVEGEIERWHGPPEGAWETLEHVDEALTKDGMSLQYGTSMHVERGVSYDPATGRAEFADRKPGEELRGRFAGSADLVYLRTDHVLVVVDWKTGAQQARLEDVDTHWQLWTLGLAFARALRHAGPLRLELRHVSAEGIRVDGVDVAPDELLEHEVRLGALARRLDSYERPHPGAWCRERYCPCVASCRAQLELVRAVKEDIAEELPPEVLTETPLDDDGFRMLDTLIDAVESWLIKAKERRKAYLLTRPQGVEILPGIVRRVKAVTREEAIESDAAAELIRSVFLAAAGEAGDLALEAVKRAVGIRITKGAVEKAAGHVADKLTVAIASSSDRRKARTAAKHELLEELRRLKVLIPAGSSYKLEKVKAGVVVERDGEAVDE